MHSKIISLIFELRYFSLRLAFNVFLNLSIQNMKIITYSIIPVILAISVLSIACHHISPEEKAKEDLAQRKKNAKLLLKSIKGIRYTEVKRVFDNGLSFNQDGYRLKPSWRLSFSSPESVNIFNPDSNMFIDAP